MKTWKRCISILTGAGVLWTAPLQAQTTGAITVTVVDDMSGQALEAALIQIPALELGGYSDDRGRLTLSDVPAGELEVSVELIGFSRGSATVAVQAGQTTAVELRLEPRGDSLRRDRGDRYRLQGVAHQPALCGDHGEPGKAQGAGLAPARRFLQEPQCQPWGDRRAQQLVQRQPGRHPVREHCQRKPARSRGLADPGAFQRPPPDLRAGAPHRRPLRRCERNPLHRPGPGRGAQGGGRGHLRVGCGGRGRQLPDPFRFHGARSLGQPRVYRRCRATPTLGAIWGRRLGGAHAIVAGEWRKRRALPATDRDYLLQPWHGSSGQRFGWSSIGNPGTFAVGAPAPWTAAIHAPDCEAFGGYRESWTCRFRYQQYENLVEDMSHLRVFSEVNGALDNGTEYHFEGLVGRPPRSPIGTPPLRTLLSH